MKKIKFEFDELSKKVNEILCFIKIFVKDIKTRKIQNLRTMLNQIIR